MLLDRSMYFKRYAVGLMILLTLILGGVLLKKYIIYSALSHYKAPPVHVQLSVLKNSDWIESVYRPATVDAFFEPKLVVEQTAKIETLFVIPGQYVKAGDKLLELQRNLITPQLIQAQAQCVFDTDYALRQQSLYQSNAAAYNAYEQSWTQAQKSCANYELMQEKDAQYTLYAPADGVLGDFDWSEGDWMPAGTAFTTFVQPESLEIFFSIPAHWREHLVEGQTLNCILYKNSYPVVVRSIAPFVDPHTQQLIVRAVFKDVHTELLSGLRGRVELQLTHHDSAYFLIPQEALSVTALGPVVWIYDSDAQNVKSHSVEIKSFLSKEVLIYAPTLQSADRIVTFGQFKLKDGQGVVVDAAR